MILSDDCKATTHDYCEAPRDCECACHAPKREPTGHEPGGFATIEMWRQAQKIRQANPAGAD